jgi:fatty acid desaturase
MLPANTNPPFKWTIQQIHAIVPKELHEKNTLKSFFYTARIIAVVYAFYKLATFIDPLAESLPQYGFSQGATSAIKWSLWSTYWIWQSFGFAGFWTLAHEAGHGALSPKKWICTAIGYPLMIVCHPQCLEFEYSLTICTVYSLSLPRMACLPQCTSQGYRTDGA